MSIKSVIKLFIPPIFYKLKEIRINKTKICSTISEISKYKTSLVILGNGPTMKNTIDKHLVNSQDHDWMVVNNFGITDYFSKVKPKYYVIADPSNLGKLEGLDENLREETIRFVKIFNIVNWNMELILPDYAREGFLVRQVSSNSNINIFYYNTKNLSHKHDLFFDYDNNLIPPPAQTVLNTCLYLGIFLNYKKIYIHGMDMSWHEDLELDQKTNQLFIVDKHFYGTIRRPAVLDVNGKIPAKVHEYLACSVRALESFWDLKKYADYKNIQVINMSPHSWVDAFERYNDDK